MAYPRILLAFILGTLVLAAADPVEPFLLKGWEQIQASHTQVTVEQLTSPAFGGRNTGEPTYTAAATWVASQFEALGLKTTPANRSYLQPYPSPHSIVDEATLDVTIGGTTKRAELLKDFLPLLFTEGGHAKGGVVFAGWGIHAPELGYDDYAGVDVRGKFVLCFRGTPSWDLKWQPYDEHRTRLSGAREQGALGLIYIFPEVLASPNGDLLPDFWPGMISDDLAARILEEKDTTPGELRTKLRRTRQPASFELHATLDLNVKTRIFPDALGYNVLGYLEGTDPALRDECVVVGAHLDAIGEHLGFLFPGADDNASGCAVVMETARALALNGLRPRRSVLFVLFGGEEQGLKGSKFFVEHLPAPFTKVTAMLNFDMVGAGAKVSVAYSSRLPDAETLLRKADAGLDVVGQADVLDYPRVRASDYGSFHTKGYPFMAFESSGPLPAASYHLPGDKPSTLQPVLMANMARLAFRLAYYLGDR